MAFKARDKMPKDYDSFCKVAEHLVRNAHRYYSERGINQSNVKEPNEESCTLSTNIKKEFDSGSMNKVKSEVVEDMIKDNITTHPEGADDISSNARV